MLQIPETLCRYALSDCGARPATKRSNNTQQSCDPQTRDSITFGLPTTTMLPSQSGLISALPQGLLAHSSSFHLSSTKFMLHNSRTVSSRVEQGDRILRSRSSSLASKPWKKFCYISTVQYVLIWIRVAEVHEASQP